MSGVNQLIRQGKSYSQVIAWLLLFLTGTGLTLRAQVPVAEFTANKTSGCAPLVVTFTDQSVGKPTSWNWGFSNGQLANVQNPTITFSQPGTYSVSLVVQNADGTHGITKTDYITVFPSPTANFTSNITTGCVPVTVQFTDNSVPQSGTINAWEWEFGDGGTSTQQNPSHTYTAVGFYNVTLRVTSSTGCSGGRTAVRYIRIVEGVTADFNNTPPVKCTAPFAVNFQNYTAGPGTLTYQWDFGNSTNSSATDPTANYATAGTYNVRLIAQSQYGCGDTITKPVTIDQYTTVINSPDTVCLNTPVNFQNGSTPAPQSSVWTFGNGVTSTNISDTTSYNSPGNYPIKLVNTYATCVDSVPKTITVLPKPTVDFTAPNVMNCQAPFTVNFQDISPDAVAWQWDFGDGSTSSQQNPAHTYQDTGRFTVTLTITTSKGCQNTISKPAYISIVRARLAITNAPNGGCIPFNYAPVANVNAIDGVASWFWDFGDGFTSTAQSPPPHTYTTAGTFALTLRVTTNGGCVETLTLPTGIRTGTPPVVNFSINTKDTCANSTISFTDLSTPPVDTWAWNFGDGTTSNQQNPTHTFADTGTFSVNLTAFNNRCGSSASAKVVHIKPPIADFNFNVQDCNNKRVVLFDDLSKTDPSYGPVSYQWSFGDPGNSTSTFPGDTLFTYPGLGSFTVQLTVTNGSCSHTISKVVKLVGDVADFTLSKTRVCKDEVFTATAINSVPANVSKYEWSVGGGPYVTGGPTLQTSFANAGNFNIGLRITDINGCTDEKIVTNAISVTGPTANFTLNNSGACNNTVVTFNDLSTPAGTISQWSWDFGDGRPPVTMNGAPFTHTFTDTGSYTIRLTVRDNAGCTNSYTLPYPVLITRPLPGFTSTFTNVCPDVPVQFTDTSTGRSLSWFWDLGDGTTSTLQNPMHTYTGSDSNYTVKLYITDEAGCRDSVIATNRIMVRAPKPAFTVTDTTTICPPIATKFTFQGQDYSSFYWDFGDGGETSTQQNPTYFYNSYGSFTATLYLTGYGGCTASASTVINVYNPGPSTNITYSPLRACNELMVDFNVTTPPATKFTFYFGDGNFDTTQSNTFQHFYNRPNYYYPYLILTDRQDCQIGVSGSQRIEVIGALPLFGKDKKAFCDTGLVTFQDYTLAPQDPVVSRVWDFGDNTTSNALNPSHFYSQPGTYEVTHTVTTQQGCSNTVRDTVRVYGTPFVRINGDTVACIDEILPLQGELIRPDTAITWSWTLGNGSGSTITNPTVSYGAAGFYGISVITSNALNCRDTAYKAVYVPENPLIAIEQEPTIVVGTGITIPVTYSDSIANYLWSPSYRLSCTDCATPFASPQFTTTYKIAVEDVYGCKSSRDITVTVICNQQNYFIPNTFSPNGDGMNDIFAPRGKSVYRVNSMKIFNRWGELIWEKRNFMVNDRSPSGGWDGTYKGKPAQQDVYVYIIELVCDNAQIIPYKGNVTLIR